MKKIYLDIEENHSSSDLKRLVGDFWSAGIEVRPLTESSWGDMAQALVLTDRQATADRTLGRLTAEGSAIALQRKTACVGYEPSGAGITLSHLDMVVQGFEELDVEFFRKVYQRCHGIPWTIARTDRLLLRESVPDDFDALYDMYQQPGMTDYMPGLAGEKEEERETFCAYIRRMYPFYGYGLWTVEEKSGGQIVGRAGLENGAFQGRPVPVVGYMIGTEYQRQGYGQEAVRAAAEYGLSELGMEKIYGFVHEKNQNSRRLIERVGFQRIEEHCEITVQIAGRVFEKDIAGYSFGG
ncbi:GNAT family N-acetyltransferase [Lachnospiraceae bacterium 46-15]